MRKYPKIGSYTPLNNENGLLPGCVEMAINEDANCLIFYTGAPQNTKRRDVKEFEIPEFHEAIKNSGFDINNVMIHAPYVINLANSVKPNVYDFGVDFLKQEIKRAEEIGVKLIVLHPGAAVGATPEVAMNQLIKGLNDVMETKPDGIRIALETMAGKGSEIGITFEQLAYIINGVKNNDELGVCMDTCHVYDGGYDIKDHWDEVKEQFIKTLGADKMYCMHINDSKFGLNSHKDRHANIGYGMLGVEALSRIVNDEIFKDAPKVLETPYVDGKAPYKYEIQELITGKQTDFLKDL